MIESPFLIEFEEKIGRRKLQGAILDCLDARFGSVPEEISSLVRSVANETRLNALLRFAATCADLTALRAQLLVEKSA